LGKFDFGFVEKWSYKRVHRSVSFDCTGSRFAPILLQFSVTERLFSTHSHPIGNRLKAIDFIGVFELHGTKKRLIPSHSTKKRQKRPMFEGFCGIPVG
jgi:hypothetical protein